MAEHTDPAPRDTELQLDRRIALARRDLMAAMEPDAPPIGQVRSRARRRHGAFGAAMLVIAVAASVTLLADRPASDTEAVISGPVDGSGGANADLLEPGETRLMSPSPLPGASSMAVVWTGSEMIIWGGDHSDGPLDVGAAYDPRSDTWRLLAPGPLDARGSPTAVWTGHEVLIWGGHGEGVDHTDGAAYDPDTDTWRPIADAPIRSAGQPAGIWTGTEMVVFAGFNSTEAAVYDAQDDSWRQLAPLPGPPMPPNPQFAFTGDTIYGYLSYPGVSMSGGVFAYDIAGDSWTELPRTHDGSHLGHLVWTGQELLTVSMGDSGLVARYDEQEEAWVEVAPWPGDADSGPFEVSAWTGSGVLLWGGEEAFVLDPHSGTWESTPGGGIPPRSQPASVWADGVLLVWGGWQERSDGVVLRPRVPPGGPRPPSSVLEAPTHTPDRVPVVDSDGVRRGTFDRNAPPASWDGRSLPVSPVEDDDGNVVGYFGCRFLERSEVERDDFDLSAVCPPPTTIVETGPGSGHR